MANCQRKKLYEIVLAPKQYIVAEAMEDFIVFLLIYVT